MKLIVSTMLALTVSATAAMAQPIDSPANIRPDAIGNGTPAQGVVRFRSTAGDTFHQVNRNTLYRRADGGTASVNGGDGISNAHEAELRNRDETLKYVLDNLPDAPRPKRIDMAAYEAKLASSTALGGLHFRELQAGQVGWAAGIGGQFRGDAAIAMGINYGLTDNVSMNASISRSFKGGEVSAFVGVSGRF